MADRQACMFVGWALVDHHWVKGPPCDRPATQEVLGGQKRPWRMCGKHAPDAAKALSIGQTGDFSATTRRLK